MVTRKNGFTPYASVVSFFTTVHFYIVSRIFAVEYVLPQVAKSSYISRDVQYCSQYSSLFAHTFCLSNTE